VTLAAVGRLVGYAKLNKELRSAFNRRAGLHRHPPDTPCDTRKCGVSCGHIDFLTRIVDRTGVCGESSRLQLQLPRPHSRRYCLITMMPGSLVSTRSVSRPADRLCGWCWPLACLLLVSREPDAAASGSSNLRKHDLVRIQDPQWFISFDIGPAEFQRKSEVLIPSSFHDIRVQSVLPNATERLASRVEALSVSPEA